MSSSTAFTAYALAVYIFYCTVIVIYRLWFHPLSRFPGPRLAAATDLYEIYFDLVKRPGGCFAAEVSRMHDQYGSLVRINANELHVKDSEWFDTLYAGPLAGRRNKYPPAALMTGTPLGIFGTVDHDTHRQRRAAVNPLFSRKTVLDSTGMIYDKAFQLLDFMERATAKGYAEARSSFLAFTTDVLCAHTFDLSLNLLEKEDAALDWKRNIKAVALLTPLAKQATWLLPTVIHLPVRFFSFLLPNLARIVSMHRYMHRQARTKIDQYNAGTLKPTKGVESSNDVFRAVLHSSLPAREKYEKRIAQEGFVILAAGGETTGRVLCNSVYFILANNISILPRLRAELAGVMPTQSSRPDLKQLEALPFLTAIIKESLRITALVTSRLPLISPDRPLFYKQDEIPAGTPVSMTPRDVLLDATIFEDPHSFRPERWLDAELAMDRLSRHFIPFGRGSRMCIGINLAMAELYIGLAVIFRNMELDLHETIRARDIDISRDCFIGEVSPGSPGIRFLAKRKPDSVREA